jgi:hypothetical protein
MAVQMTGASSQNINFGNTAGGYVHKLYMLWIYKADTTRGTIFFKGNDPYTQGWACSIENSGGMKIFFGNKFSGVDGLWRGSSTVSSGFYHIAIEYDNSLTTNDPRIWINNAAETIVETSTPTGTNDEGTGSLTIGDDITADSNYGINGTHYSFIILNVSGLTSAAIDAIVADAYNSRKAIPTYNGLVFAPQLNGAAGLQTFDGTTLTGSNTIVDAVSGAVGVPSGSPVGVADTYLTFED